MKYPVTCTGIIDVTKPPYCADNTGKIDCTDILRKILDDVLIRQVDALQKTYDKLVEMSDNLKEDVYIGIEGGRVQKGKLSITFPEDEPSSKIIYFPEGTYLVSDTIIYTLENLKQLWYWVPGFENCRNIHFLGESRENTIIKLADNTKGFEYGCNKPLISFVNKEMEVKRTEEYTNVAFMNTLKDITLDCGTGNPGAVGVKYVSSNCGKIENVNIRTEQGIAGIFVSNTTSQAVFANISISGFDYGIDAERTNIIFVDKLDLSENKISGIYTCFSTMICDKIISGDIPAIKFKELNEEGGGRYYLINPDISVENAGGSNKIYYEKLFSGIRRNEMPLNFRSNNEEDWVCVDDFGAKGDGITDSSRAIQKAMDSGKPIVVLVKVNILLIKKKKFRKV